VRTLSRQTPRIEINRKSSDAVPASRKASMEKMFTVGQLFIFLHLFIFD